MNRKIPPLMVFALLWLIVVGVSWFNFPAWRNMEGGLATLVGVAAVGVLAFLKDGVSFLKDSLEYLKGTLAEPETPNVPQPDDDSKITNIPWKSVDSEILKKYLSLCEPRDKKIAQYKNEEKTIRHCISMGLAKKDKAGIFLTQAGVLLFCKKEDFPNTLLHSEVVLRDEAQDIKQTIYGSILDSYLTIREQLKPYSVTWDTPKSRDDFGSARKFSQYPDLAITEVLVNFFGHRDYQSDDRGYITIYPDRIEFTNPGITKYSADELLAVTEPLHPKYRRNPRLLQALENTGFGQREGRGILRIKESLESNESRLPDGSLGLKIKNDPDSERFTLIIFKKEAPRILVVESAGNIINETYIEKQQVIIHDTIGFIPPTKVVSYVNRGKIEEDVRNFLLAGGTGAIIGLHAPGGLGKTELAKHAAEDLKDQFEGVLWIDVGEKTASQVVTDMLYRCGVQMPPNSTYEQQKGELRHYLSARKLLVVLDDVRVTALKDINDFLPPKPSAALLTSRIQQIGGVNKTFELDAMTSEQAMELLKAILGEDVVHAELESALKLVERCAWNPLAIEIAARRIRQLQGIKKPIARYFEMVQARFHELRIEGDERWNMETVFDLSYNDLSPEDQKRFRALTVFAPTGFSLSAAAHLWELDESDATDIISRFVNLSLIVSVKGELERYRLHDLLGEYAGEKLRKDKDEEKQAYASLAGWLIALFNQHYTDDLSTAPEVAEERANLLKACEWVYGQKDAEILARLVTTSRNWFYVSFADDWHYWIIWLEAANKLGISDRQLKANVLQAIGDVQQFRDERDAALESYNQALMLFRQVGAKLGEANVLQSIGDVQQFRKDNDAALESYNQALMLFRQVGAKLGEANVRKAIGNVQQYRDERDAALESYSQALMLFRQVGDKLGEANVRKAIGDVQQFRDERDAALESYNQALMLFRQIGAKLGEANVLQAIGDVQQFRDEQDAALESYNQALMLFRQVGDKLGEANVLQAIGDVQQFRKENDAALESYNEALNLFQQIGDKLGEANVRKAIGDVQQYRDEQEDALESYNYALMLFRQVGDKLGEANVLQAIGYVQQFRDERDAALESYNYALMLFRQVGDKLGEANVLQAIGDVQQFRDERDAALKNYNQALMLFRQVGARLGEANVLMSLARLSLHVGNVEIAEKQLEQSVEIQRMIGNVYGEGANFANYAISLLQLGNKDKAREYAKRALPIFTKINSQLVEQINRIIEATNQ
jgi:tetratricopeptide (TPR) repeat protein